MDDFIVNVWRHNLEEEMKNVRQLVHKYKYIAMDTEFPGVVARPSGNFSNNNVFLYQQLRCNVDILKPIQLGLTFADENGFKPTPCTYQFNFHFDTSRDMYKQESLELLMSANIDFERHAIEGISVEAFGEAFYRSGLVLSSDIFWISFHSSYDFGYLIKVLTCNPLPKHEDGFFILLNLLFPNFLDIKYALRGSKYIKKGLKEIADDFGLARLGTMHQAGSDSYLTCILFFEARDEFFQGDNEIEKNLNKLFGIELYPVL